MRRSRFTGIAHLPSALPVTPDILGLVEKVKIDGSTVIIALPRLEPDTGNVIAPEIEGHPLAEVLLKTLRSSWGYRSTTKLYYIGNVTISFMLAPTGIVAASPEFGGFGRAFFSWFEIVRDWAAAWSGEPLRQVVSSEDAAIHVPTGRGLIAGTGGIAGSAFFGAKPLSLVQVRGAFRRASRGEHLPTEHRLLLSADLAGHQGDLRRSAIDAGTAAEVALASAITQELAGKVTTEFIRLSIENANGVVGLIKLYTSLGHALAVSKNRAMDQLANVRNRAAHGGHVPTEEEIIAAIQTARSLVQDTRPLPSE